MAAPRKVAYLTDVEGMWSRLESFARDNPVVSLGDDDRLTLHEGGLFVFGGDAIDRGPHGRRLVRTLTDAKLRYPDRVFLLAGNRDINKLRLWLELQDRPHPRSPEEVRKNPAALLRWIFQNTMGAAEAFSMRAEELGPRASDADVVQSYLADLQPEGDLTHYLGLCQLGVHLDSTLFVHGAVTAENLGAVPGVDSRAPDVDAWVAGLNAWFHNQVEAFRTRTFESDGTPGWQSVVAYQAPKPGTRLNQASVVYGRLTDDLQNPHLPERAVVQSLLAQGIARVAVGHTPAGDVPSVLRADGFELILADNSHGRVDTGSQITVEGETLEVQGHTVLDSGEKAELRYRLVVAEPAPVGRIEIASGSLVKGPLTDGRLYLWRGLPGYAVEQRAVPARDLGEQQLQPSRFAD